jgi:fumarate reductase (CoM/CoB) subunit A
MPESPLETDVLVAGGGGAGARAAIAAQEAGASVTLVTKHFLGRSGCTPKLVYMSVVGPWCEQGDSPELAIQDILRSGGSLGSLPMLRILVDESPARLADLESYGARFDKKDGHYDLSQLAGHSKPRTLTFRPRKLGSSMMSALAREVRRRKIRVIDQAILTRLFVREGAVVGAAVLDYSHGEFFPVSTRSVVLATGGYGAVYSPATVTKEDTGDGHALAFDAGAELMDVENVSFLPGLNRAWGSQRGWGETPHFLNTRGERFMLRYNPGGAEFGTKEVITQAIAKEVLEGRGTENGGVYSDLRYLPWDNPSVQSDMSDLVERGRRFGADPRKTQIEMWPLAHTPTGGVPVDENCATSVPGLFAAGAVAGGIYGFGRIEGFTSMITQVFGQRAGAAAAARAAFQGGSGPVREDVDGERERVYRLLESSGGLPPSRVRGQMQSAMYRSAWILRDAKGLTAGLETILKLKDEKVAPSSNSKILNLEWVEALELPHLLLMAELILRGSLMRTESRGSFVRTDYPQTDDDNWLANIVFTKSGSGPVASIRRAEAGTSGKAAQSVEAKGGL